MSTAFNFKQHTDPCIKCGKCIPVCTIHQVNPDETTSPRGFLELLGAYQEGRLELDKNAKDIFESCFLCTNCVNVCPKSLPTDQVIEQVRADIAKKFGLAWFKKAFFKLLKSRSLMDAAFRSGFIFTPCAFKKHEQSDSMIPRFSLPLLPKNRLLPSTAHRSFLNSYPELVTAKGNRKVAVFIGCLANYNYKGIGESLLEILGHLEINAFLAKKQLCCGAPAYFTGDFETVDYVAKKNIEYFESFIDEVEAIIIPESTCSAMIRIDYEHFFHDQEEWKERAIALKKKVYMATEWLEKETSLSTLLETKKQQNEIITYHDPCHAKKMQGVYKEPRTLLKKSYTITEMDDSDRCCGFGGVTMQSEKYEYARLSGIPKAKMIAKTEADIVSAECSACRMQLNNAMFTNDVQTVFKNPIELIAEALKE